MTTIEDIAREMRTQDNMGTADLIFNVEEKVRDYGYDTQYSDEPSAWLFEDGEPIDEKHMGLRPREGQERGGDRGGALMETWQLQQRQSLPLACKVKMTMRRIREWYEYWEGQVYVAFSGGKDSTVLLHLVRSLYPEVPGVFCDTGLEYPEIREFVKATDNVTWLRPSMCFREVIDKHGYPVVSKEVSQAIYEVRTTKSEKLRHKRLHGDNNKYRSGKIANKWQYLIDAPFLISDKCCAIMKKSPSKKYEKETGRHPFIGTMASEGRLRVQAYLKNGCNTFEGRGTSTPLAFWLEDDIWAYIREGDIPYSVIYDMGEERTGCMFCMFGCHRDDKNRFQRMRETHPKQWEYCINTLGLGEVLDFLRVDYNEWTGQQELFSS